MTPRIAKRATRIAGMVVVSVVALGTFSNMPATAVESVSQSSASKSESAAPPPRKLDPTTFVVLGEGLAAGMENFGLSEEDQKASFPAQIARQMQVSFTQPLFQAPGIGEVPGFPSLPVRVPRDLQTTVFSQFPPAGPLSNLSVPGFRLSDALTRRPAPPMVRQDDARQTATNLILGIPGIMMAGMPLPTQLEYALSRHPTFAVIELGFGDVCEAAAKGDLASLPEVTAFRAGYAQLVKALRDQHAEVIIATIPDPIDTAYFSSIDSAARVVKAQPAVIRRLFGLKAGDRVSVNGLVDMGIGLLTRQARPLPQSSILKAEVAGKISTRVQALNAQLAALAKEQGAVVYDLHALFRKVRTTGIAAGSRKLTADFLGGFYSLNGVYPGATGQALIATEILEVLNKTYGTAFSPVDIGKVLDADPVAKYRPAEGPDLTLKDLSQPLPKPPSTEQATRAGGPAADGVAEDDAAEARSGGTSVQERASTALKLPPGLEEVLPLSKESSYYGDALRALNCRDEKDVPFFGHCSDLLFGGLAIVDSHLSGSIQIKFSPPVNNVTHFQVTHGRGLVGDDSILAAPLFFKLPAGMHQVGDAPNMVSSGDLNLATGEVSNLDYKLMFMNTAILALAKVNPKLPAQPMSFPGQYGSAWARFEQRSDGKLDFSFYGSTFLPLGHDFGGDPIRFPLPFAGPSLQFASIPSIGTALHPHIYLSTRAPEGAPCGSNCPDIPVNTIQEFTANTHNTAFGDHFTLHSTSGGGEVTGRSHVLGRIQIQFGERFGDSVSIAVSALPPGGMLAAPPDSPLAKEFPGTIPMGMIGHNEFLRFPLRTYYMNTVAILDDPFDIALGAVDLRTGRVIAPQLHRGFIAQNVIFALLRVEPRTPKSTFFFRGPAWFEKSSHGQTVFRYESVVRVPYPPGYKWPEPDFVSSITAGPGSLLDPYWWIQAMHGGSPPHTVKTGSASNVLASTGERFSYSYAIPTDAGKDASFEYTNHAQGGAFQLQKLAWVDCINSRTSTAPAGDCDTITFTGYGTWSTDPSHAPHIAAVQVSTSREAPYVSIQIDGGLVSNVNTKPANPAEARP